MTFTVVAVNTTLGWVSDSPAAVSFTKQPSATQLCTDPPTLEAMSSLRFSKRKLKRSKWKLALKLRASGIGRADVTLIGRKRLKKRRTTAVTLLTLPLPLTAPGDQTLRVTLPIAARKLGSYTLRVLTTAPDNKTQTTNTLKLEVRR